MTESVKGNSRAKRIITEASEATLSLMHIQKKQSHGSSLMYKEGTPTKKKIHRTSNVKELRGVKAAPRDIREKGERMPRHVIKRTHASHATRFACGYAHKKQLILERVFVAIVHIWLTAHKNKDFRCDTP